MSWKDAPIVEEAQPAWASAPVVEAPAQNQYRPFSVVRKDIDPKSLDTDPDWLEASRMMYQLWNQKPFEGSDAQLSEFGKKSVYNFEFDIISMAQIANRVTTQGTQEEKEAFLWMLDTYDNTNVTLGGVGRAAKTLATDPFTYLGLGTLGAGFVAKEGIKATSKQGIREALKQSMGRTGITAAVEGAAYGGYTSSVRQGVEVSAGRRDEISLGKTALDAGIAGTAGLVLGTSADLALTKIVSAIRGIRAPEAPSATPRVDPEGTPPVNPEAPQVNPEIQNIIDGNIPNAGTRDPNLGNTLSPAEVSEAIARNQPGRRAVDDTAAVPLGRTDIQLEIPATNTGLRSTPQSMSDLTERGTVVADQLRGLQDNDLATVLEQLRTSNMSLEESRVASRGVQMYADELRIQWKELQKQIDAKPDAEDVATLIARKNALEARMAPVDLADEAFGSMAGSMLRQRQEGLPGVTGRTIENIMETEKVSRADAEKIYSQEINDAQRSAEVRAVAAEYDPKMVAAMAEDDYDMAVRLAIEKSRTTNAITEELVPGSTSFMAKLTEFAISQVFSVKTLFVNMIPSGLKTLVIPAMKAIVNNPLEKATRIEMMASYNAMRVTFKGALKASAEAYKYEQALLTRDSNKLLEGGLAIKGKYAGAIRLFPRLINATDEFLSQLNYASYVASKAAGEAYVEGAKSGLKGRQLDKAVKEAIDKAQKAAFEGVSGDDIINPIIAKGLNIGYTGDELFRYVEREISSNGVLLSALGYKNKDFSLFRRGTDTEALDYVRDVLYKRTFSGQGFASETVSRLDETFRNYPSLKYLTGQLFFRTPVRVFEEGVRLTPGLQLLAPNFIADLKGANGVNRQIRAQGEALASLGMTGMILSLYSQGRITGDFAYDNYHQQKLRSMGSLQEPYTIKFSDGSTWSYRNFDPIATPVKIIVNALERYERLRLRELQGEFIDKSEIQKTVAVVSVATGAISRAFIDAGLTEGLNQMSDIYKMLADPENEDSIGLRYVGERLNTLVPNTLRKIARENDPTIKDPANFWQLLEQRLLAPIPSVFVGDGKIQTSFSYDVLGNPRRSTSEGFLLDFFDTVTPEERTKGLSEEAIFVLNEMDRLQRVTGATFRTPIKHRELGDTDLRVIMSKDGRRTLYDVWQDNYRELNPTQALYPILSAPLPDGTFRHKGARVEAVRDIMNQYQETAFQMLMAEEQQVLDRYIREQINKVESKAGLFDTPRPY